VMIHRHHAAERTGLGLDQNAWVSFGKQGWVNSRECRSIYVRPSQTRCCQRKKTADAIRQEIASEIDQLLRIVFNGRRKTGRLDLEATFDHGRQQMKLLADLEVTTKALEQKGGGDWGRYRQARTARDGQARGRG